MNHDYYVTPMANLSCATCNSLSLYVAAPSVVGLRPLPLASGLGVGGRCKGTCNLTLHVFFHALWSAAVDQGIVNVHKAVPCHKHISFRSIVLSM